jgi:predicted permease
MASFWQDIRYSFRVIAKAPGFAALAILTLALGIGANTTIFSWINSTLLNPVPGLSKPTEVVAMAEGEAWSNPMGFTYPDVEAIRDGQKSFTGIAACGFAQMSLTNKTQQERVSGMVATANYFDVLGVRPYLGRTFLPSEDEKPGGAAVAVIGYRLWQVHFGGDPSVIGRTVDINQQPYTIVGVTPPDFHGSQTGVRTDIWVPIMMEEALVPHGDLIHDHHYFWLLPFGRLKPGVTATKAQQEMTVLLSHEVKNYPEEHKGHEAVKVYPLWRNPFGLNQFMSTLLPALMVIAGIVLLLACANVANLMLVRAVGRRREVAIRMSLGASRWRLIRQLLVESLILALAGGGAALLITVWTQGSLMRFMPVTPDIPFELNVSTDRTMLVATLVISILTGLIFGILPALRASGESPVNVLKEDAANSSGGLRRARLASALVVLQISLSLLLLVCAGLFIRSFLHAAQINPGFNERNVLIASYDLFTGGYNETTGEEFHRQLVSRIQTLPGVESVALTNRVPLGFDRGSTIVKPEGYVSRTNDSMETQVANVTPNFFHTMQIPLIEGRDFTWQDDNSSQRVAIVSKAFVGRYWPNQDAIGKKFQSDLTYEWFTVIGVAQDVKEQSLSENPEPFVYLPVYQVYHAGMMVAARVAGNPMALRDTLIRTIHSMNTNLVVYDVTTVESRAEASSFSLRIAGTFVGAFGLLALALAGIGIYGVTAYTTRQRTHEIGIRMTLGASKEDVLRLVLGHGLRLMLTGVGIGLVLALVLTRFLGGLLLGVTSTDVLTFSSVALLLCAVALFACFVPARRAMRLDPTVALRYE